MALERERKYFESHRDELLKNYRNLFVLIKGEEVIGAFPDAESAYQEGVHRFGLEPFLVRQVLETEPIAVSPILSVVAPRARI